MMKALAIVTMVLIYIGGTNLFPFGAHPAARFLWPVIALRLGLLRLIAAVRLMLSQARQEHEGA